MTTAARVLAIITARGGSKTLPGKNVRMLAGKPLIAHTIEAAQQSPRVSRIVVTTDDPAIAEVAREWGAEVIDRPPALATDAASSNDTVRHTLDLLAAEGDVPDIFVLLQPTSPLRKAVHVTECIDAFLAAPGMASAISVTSEFHSPYKCYQVQDGKLTPLFDPTLLSMPRQFLPHIYHQNGAIFLCRTDVFLKTHAFFNEPTLPYMMPYELSVDIDSLSDFMLAEFFLNQPDNTRGGTISG